MSQNKKDVRKAFRDEVYRRAKYRCQGPGCNVRATRETAESLLDAHHITPREQMPAGGYVAENGIALCRNGCHEKAEQVLKEDRAPNSAFGWLNLYRIIGSSRIIAQVQSKKLEEGTYRPLPAR
jgi:predicted restriction endonuclease